MDERSGSYFVIYLIYIHPCYTVLRLDPHFVIVHSMAIRDYPVLCHVAPVHMCWPAVSFQGLRQLKVHVKLQGTKQVLISYFLWPCLGQW